MNTEEQVILGLIDQLDSLTKSEVELAMSYPNNIGLITILKDLLVRRDNNSGDAS